MKAIKKMMLMASVVILFVILPLKANAAGGKVLIAVSSQKVEKNEKVSVTATAFDENNRKISATMVFSFDTGKFSYEGCNAAGASVSGGKVTVTGTNATITLKGKEEGRSTVTVKGTDSHGTGLTAAGVNLTVEGEGTEKKSNSADNSLKSLTIEGAELSPVFQYATTSYTATVNHDVTNLKVDAKPSHKDAEVTKITGETNLEDGENTVKIEVTAGNGSKAVYKIVVTRLADGEEKTDETVSPDTEKEGTGIFQVGDQSYAISECMGDNVLPEGLKQIILTVQGEEFTGYQYKTSNLFYLYLVNQQNEEDAGFYAYDPESETVCSIGADNIDSQGDLTSKEQLTYLKKNYDDLYQKYNSVKKNQTRLLLAGIAIGVILLIIILNLILFGRSDKGEQREAQPARKVREKEAVNDEYLSACAEKSSQYDGGKSSSHKEDKISMDTGKTKQNSKKEEDEIEFIDFDDM